jgi:hypothetical protein
MARARGRDQARRYVSAARLGLPALAIQSDAIPLSRPERYHARGPHTNVRTGRKPDPVGNVETRGYRATSRIVVRFARRSGTRPRDLERTAIGRTCDGSGSVRSSTSHRSIAPNACIRMHQLPRSLRTVDARSRRPLVRYRASTCHYRLAILGANSGPLEVWTTLSSPSSLALFFPVRGSKMVPRKRVSVQPRLMNFVSVHLLLQGPPRRVCPRSCCRHTQGR